MYVCIFVRLIYLLISYFSKQTFEYCVTSWLVDSNLRPSRHKSTYLTTGPHSETSKLQYLVARNPHHSHHASWCPLPVPHYTYIHILYTYMYIQYTYMYIYKANYFARKKSITMGRSCNRWNSGWFVFCRNLRKRTRKTTAVVTMNTESRAASRASKGELRPLTSV